MSKNGASVVTFFVLTIIWSWLWWLPGLLGIEGPVSFFAGLIAASGPSIVALVLTGLYEGREGVMRLLCRGVTLDASRAWLVPILFFWPVLAGLAFALTRVLGGATGATPLAAQPWMVGPMFLFMLFASGALEEEFGWRGFALDRLQARWSALVSGLVLGLVWSLWHLPLHFIAGTTQSAIPIWQFWAITTVGSVFYTWIHNNTGGSIMAAMLFHAMSNLSVWMFPYWESDYGRYVGFGLAVVAAVVVVWVWGPTSLAGGLWTRARTTGFVTG